MRMHYLVWCFERLIVVSCLFISRYQELEFKKAYSRCVDIILKRSCVRLKKLLSLPHWMRVGLSFVSDRQIIDRWFRNALPSFMNSVVSPRNFLIFFLFFWETIYNLHAPPNEQECVAAYAWVERNRKNIVTWNTFTTHNLFEKRTLYVSSALFTYFSTLCSCILAKEVIKNGPWLMYVLI